jgi:ribonuclease P protein component
MIKKNYEFKRFFSKGNVYRGKFIYMYIHKSNRNINKLGIAVSKKVGKAVQRNHIKRLIRENYKIYEEKINNYFNIVIIVKNNLNIKEVTYYDINSDFYYILKKAGMIDEKISN